MCNKTPFTHYALLGIIGFVLILVNAQAGSAMPKKSHEYGNIEINRNTAGNRQEPVVFKHWNHRSKHTCRLCHVDIEFSMEANGTGILEEDNKAGRYCGTCHNGKETFSITECSKCHPKDSATAKQMEREAKRAFFAMSKSLPRALYGNKIDWVQAEQDGKIVPKDFIEGVSFPAADLMKNTRDEPRSPKLPGLPDIIFSHSKHVVWSGCGMCHPAPFALETGKTQMSMKEITEGKFCGICHGKVAFPLNDCGNCHSKPVQ